MEIEKAFKRLLIKSPFYGLFCLGLSKEVTDDYSEMPSLGVRRKGLNCELLINKDFWDKHTDEQQLALLQHELSHICLQHMFMDGYFSNKQVLNVACDMEVNSYIENLPPGGCFPRDIGMEKGLGSKTYYEALIQKQEEQRQKAQDPMQPCNGGQGDRNSDSDPKKDKNGGENNDSSGEDDKDRNDDGQYPDFVPNGKKPLDSHKSWDDFKRMPEATQQLVQNNINTLMKSAAEQAEKQNGTIPGELQGIISKLREKKPEVFNWKAYFRRMLGSIYDVNIKATRRKPSKRYPEAPGIQHRKKVSILVAVDTSASVSKKELQDFISEINYIHKAGARVTVLQCDTRITSNEEYDGKMEITIKGRGGTSFDPPVDYYIEHKKEYASLIYFTDGECSLPRRKPSGMVWVITSNGFHQDYPGKVVYIPPEHK